jgi:hypothetical protein
LKASSPECELDFNRLMVRKGGLPPPLVRGIPP